MLDALYFFCLVCLSRCLSTYFAGSSVQSGSQIFHIGTVICFDAYLARRTLWYIPIFHLVAHANILGADCSTISSNGIAKYLDICSGMIIDCNEYKSVTVCVASVILTMRFSPVVVDDGPYYALTIIPG